MPTVIDSFYLLALGSYRALYCVNWFVRGLDPDDNGVDTVSVIFGVIQTALYLDFAWVYYTRQRVKLRGGGIVDADDMRHSWLLRRIFGHKRFQNVDDEENVPVLDDEGQPRRTNRAKWGTRGISVSADEGVLDSDRRGRGVDDDDDDGELGGVVDPDAKMQDPDELAKALDDDPLDGPSSGSANRNNNGTPSGIRSGDEWRD